MKKKTKTGIYPDFVMYSSIYKHEWRFFNKLHDFLIELNALFVLKLK